MNYRNELVFDSCVSLSWQEEVTKKRTRRAVKCQRAITGASLAEILAKRNQKPEVRKALREQAIRWVSCPWGYHSDLMVTVVIIVKD